MPAETDYQPERWRAHARWRVGQLSDAEYADFLERHYEPDSDPALIILLERLRAADEPAPDPPEAAPTEEPHVRFKWRGVWFDRQRQQGPRCDHTDGRGRCTSHATSRFVAPAVVQHLCARHAHD